MESLTLEDQRLLQAEISSGETVLWTGKPNPRVIFHPSDWFVIPFSILWSGFTIFWEAGVSGLGPWAGKGDPWSFGTLWGIPFILIGQYMLWGRFFYIAWKKKRIVYALTSEQILVIVRPPQQKAISRYLRNVPGIEKEIRSDGIGTLKFGETLPMWSTGRNNNTADPLYLNSSTPVFVDIDNAADTADLVTRQLRMISTNHSTS